MKRCPTILWPLTAQEWLGWLNDFLEHLLPKFGPHEEAISRQHTAVYHSLLTPALNSGLLTPEVVVQAALSTRHVPLASLEGFVRQIIGWREFVRGIYRFVPTQGNFWGHRRKLTRSWYEGSTGIDPLDITIRRVTRDAYCHHIERLMILGNVMLLSEIDPSDVYRWFMEMFIDSSDWVMEPNVFGMSQFADGGKFATKPYICGSNYITKMSDHRRGAWTKTLDGLYWNFIQSYRSFFEKNPRLGMMVRLLDKMGTTQKELHFRHAAEFLGVHTG